MILNRLKFKYKLYLLSIIMLCVIVGSHVVSLYQDKRLSLLIYELSNNNEVLNSTLLNLSQVERLRYLVEKYHMTASQEYLDKINQMFYQLLSLEVYQDKSNDSIIKKQQRLIESIKQYQKTFQIASKQIPRNYELRAELRKTVQDLKDSIFQRLTESKSTARRLSLSLLLNAVLATERNVIRFLETNESDFIKKADKFVQIKNAEIVKMAELKTLLPNELTELTTLSMRLNKVVKQAIGHYRTYSMVTKVMMPGNANEINFYSQKLQSEILVLIDEYKQQIAYYHEKRAQLNAFFSFLLGFIVLLGLFLITRLIMGAFTKLTFMFEQLALGNKDVDIPEYKLDDEVGRLIQAAVKFQKLNEKTENLLKETEDYKANLEVKVQEQSEARAEQEKVLIQQSKLAAMGEMIGAIAHQWRQPLNELSVRIQKLKYAFAKQQVNEEYIIDFIEKNNATIQFMSVTIDDFRNFFLIDKQKTDFDVHQAVKEVLSIQSAQLKNHQISTSLEGQPFIIKGYKGELQQAILNIISNSKDALISNKTKQPMIKLALTQDSKIEIQDNGGGIPKHLMDRVMDPYFTTKEPGEGTGMGLYMTKMIIEDNLNGKIKIQNHLNGVLITIDLNGVK